jgi:hypothetical protein
MIQQAISLIVLVTVDVVFLLDVLLSGVERLGDMSMLKLERSHQSVYHKKSMSHQYGHLPEDQSQQPVYYGQQHNVPPQPMMYMQPHQVPQPVVQEYPQYAPQCLSQPEQPVQYVQVTPQMLAQLAPQQFGGPNQPIYILPVQAALTAVPIAKSQSLGVGVLAISIITLLCTLPYQIFAILFGSFFDGYFIYENILGVLLIATTSVGIASAAATVPIPNQVKCNKWALAGYVIFILNKIVAVIVLRALGWGDPESYGYYRGTCYMFALISMSCAIPVIGILIGLTGARVKYFKIEGHDKRTASQNSAEAPQVPGNYPIAVDQQSI